MDVWNPWQTEAGRTAQQIRLSHLAASSGELAEFAREVVAGRAEYRDVLYSQVLSDDGLVGVRTAIGEWNELPLPAREQMIADAGSALSRYIDAVVETGLPAPTEVVSEEIELENEYRSIYDL